MDVYVGRPHPAIAKHMPGADGEWGNPFTIGKDGTRREVIDKFRAYTMSNPGFCEKIQSSLRGKVLGCWCVPNACHASVLAEIANRNIDDNDNNNNKQ